MVVGVDTHGLPDLLKKWGGFSGSLEPVKLRNERLVDIAPEEICDASREGEGDFRVAVLAGPQVDIQFIDGECDLDVCAVCIPFDFRKVGDFSVDSEHASSEFSDPEADASFSIVLQQARGCAALIGLASVFHHFRFPVFLADGVAEMSIPSTSCRNLDTLLSPPARQGEKDAAAREPLPQISGFGISSTFRCWADLRAGGPGLYAEQTCAELAAMTRRSGVILVTHCNGFVNKTIRGFADLLALLAANPAPAIAAAARACPRPMLQQRFSFQSIMTRVCRIRRNLSLATRSGTNDERVIALGTLVCGSNSPDAGRACAG